MSNWERFIGAMVAILGIATIVALIMAYSFTMTAIVVSAYWEWFFIPLGAPVLTWPHLLGLAGLIRYLTHQYRPATPDGQPSPSMGKAFHTAFVNITFGSAATLAIGWLLHRWM